ncbi:hypothetical protein Tco_1554342 [Tanacetum coccineum]
MGRDTIQLEDVVSTISGEYLLEFTSEYGIPEGLHPELPGPEETIMDFSEEYIPYCRGMAHKRPKGWDATGRLLFFGGCDNFEHTPYPYSKTTRSPTMPSKLSRNFFLGDDVYPTFLYDDGQDIDLFNLISAPNPTKVKTGTRPRAAYEVQDRLSGEIPPVENTAVTEVIPELDLGREVAAIGPLVNKRRHIRGNDEADANAPPKVLRKDHAASRPTQSTLEGKSLASMGLEAGSTYSIPASSSKGAATAGDLDSEKSSSFTSIVGSLGSIYQPGWGVTNNCRLDTPNVCQDMVDHIVPPGYFLELHYLSNDDFLSQYNINMARQVAMGSQLRLRFEQDVILLKKATSKIAKQDQRIQAREEEIKKLDQEIKSLRVVDTEVQGLRNQMRNLETLLEAEDKAAFKEFKKYEDDWVNFRYAKMDARLDALSVYFDEELYPHMLIAIAGRRWMIGQAMVSPWV